jgi:hypothetical protein
MIEWEDDKKSRKTTPLWLQDANMHRVSNVHSLGRNK